MAENTGNRWIGMYPSAYGIRGSYPGSQKNDAAGGCENGSERILSVEKEIEKSKKKQIKKEEEK